MLLSCESEKKPPPAPLSPDERYLVDAYVRVRRAGALYPFQRERAESLLTSFSGKIDTLRVARTITALNAHPERWSFVFQSIEDKLSSAQSTAPSESTR